jgi:Tfp pilus assembly protein PilN
MGGSPRVSLLPPEVHARGRARSLRRRLGLALVGVIVLVGVAVALASVSLIGAQSSLSAAQSQANSLLRQQAPYGVVTRVQADVAAIKAAQITAAQPEVAWQPYIKALEATLPKGMSITAIQGALATSASAAAVVPLQGPNIATIEVTVASPQDSITSWLNALPKLPGFVDATPGSVTAQQGKYAVDVTIHISKAALANRFPAAK